MRVELLQTGGGEFLQPENGIRQTGRIGEFMRILPVPRELIPGEAGRQPQQRTESVVGPYELQDFNNFYITRFGYLPAKIAFMAYCSWRDRSLGFWPDVPEHKRNEYTIGEIKRWLKVYLYRFFKTSQFKRSCIPNGPKVGSGGSLSPRGDYRAPSDSEPTVWLENLVGIPDEEECLSD